MSRRRSLLPSEEHGHSGRPDRPVQPLDEEVPAKKSRRGDRIADEDLLPEYLRPRDVLVSRKGYQFKVHRTSATDEFESPLYAMVHFNGVASGWAGEYEGNARYSREALQEMGVRLLFRSRRMN